MMAYLNTKNTKNTKHYTYILCALCVLCVKFTSAQEWHTGEAVVPIVNITPENARAKALAQARQNALEQVQLEVVGATSRLIKDATEGEAYDQFAKFTRSVTRGKIIDEEILLDDQIKMNNIWHYKVKLRANVVMDKIEPDANFKVDITTDRASYRDGEYMHLTITATKGCYITIFNLYSNDSILVALPNKFMENNFIYAGVSMTIPPKDAKWPLQVNLVSDKSEDIEGFLIVATKEFVPFISQGELRQNLLSFDGGLMALNRWLVDIPADQRTENWTTYRIIK